jgi:hypothetical protein
MIDHQPPGTAAPARALPLVLVAAACAFNLVAYHVELDAAAPPINDAVFHLGLIQGMDAAWDAGGDPLDTWIGYWGQGFPVLRYYQHLPHLGVLLVHRLLGDGVPLQSVFDAVRLLLLCLAPLAFFAGARGLGASRLAAACVALLTPLLGADPGQSHLLGLQPQSFLWSGGGLFAQLAAMVFFPLALGAASRAALGDRPLAPAVAWLAATWLSHLVLGYTACLLGLVVLLRPEARGRRARVALRLGAVYAGAGIVAAYLLLPALVESQWLARSAWEPAEYWDSYGAPWVIAALASGALLDGDRIPVLTALAGLGAALALCAGLRPARGGSGFAVAAVGMFTLALLLYFGRPTWGLLLDLLPFSANLPLHRFVCAVQFGGLLLAGLALAWIVERIGLGDRRRRLATGIAVVLVLGPAVASTAAHARLNARWQRDAAAAWAAGRAPLEAAFADFAALDRERPGRGYAGTSWDWGRDFRIGAVHVYHRWSAHGLAAISYLYHTMGHASDLEPAFDPARRDHHELFNVRYLLADGARRLPPFAQPRLASAGVVSGLVETGGHFGLVGSDAFFAHRPHDPDALRRLNRAFIDGEWHARGRTVRIGWRSGEQAAAGETILRADGPLVFESDARHRAPRGRIVSSGGAGDRFEARLQLENPAYVLFRMSYHPHWHAQVDGRPAPTVMLAPGYVGVPVVAGAHRLQMTYRPPPWTRVLRAAGLAFLALVALAEAWQRRRRAADSRTAPSRASVRG